jgi:gamma-glutamyl phosphate reductase
MSDALYSARFSFSLTSNASIFACGTQRSNSNAETISQIKQNSPCSTLMPRTGLRTQADPGRIASCDMVSLEKDLDFKTPRRKHAQRTPPT